MDVDFTIVTVGKDGLHEALGQVFSQEEFEELCFQIGIELDDVTTEKAIIRKEKHFDEEIIYKIEVPCDESLV